MARPRPPGGIHRSSSCGGRATAPTSSPPATLRRSRWAGSRITRRAGRGRPTWRPACGQLSATAEWAPTRWQRRSACITRSGTRRRPARSGSAGTAPGSRSCGWCRRRRSTPPKPDSSWRAATCACSARRRRRRSPTGRASRCRPAEPHSMRLAARWPRFGRRSAMPGSWPAMSRRSGPIRGRRRRCGCCQAATPTRSCRGPIARSWFPTPGVAASSGRRACGPGPSCSTARSGAPGGARTTPSRPRSGAGRPGLRAPPSKQRPPPCRCPASRAGIAVRWGDVD